MSFDCCWIVVEHVHHDALGAIPELVRTDALVRARGELDGNLVEAEVLVDREDQVVDLQALGGHLLVGAEDVRVVLREAAHAHQAVEGARRLVAMDRAEFGQADRQLAIGFQPVLEDLHVTRAVHRLQCEDAVVGFLVIRMRQRMRPISPRTCSRWYQPQCPEVSQREVSRTCGALTS